jgi:hypothetical protein
MNAAFAVMEVVETHVLYFLLTMAEKSRVLHLTHSRTPNLRRTSPSNSRYIAIKRDRIRANGLAKSPRVTELTPSSAYLIEPPRGGAK